MGRLEGGETADDKGHVVVLKRVKDYMTNERDCVAVWYPFRDCERQISVCRVIVLCLVN